MISTRLVIKSLEASHNNLYQSPTGYIHVLLTHCIISTDDWSGCLPATIYTHFIVAYIQDAGWSLRYFVVSSHAMPAAITIFIFSCHVPSAIHTCTSVMHIFSFRFCNIQIHTTVQIWFQPIFTHFIHTQLVRNPLLGEWLSIRF